MIFSELCFTLSSYPFFFIIFLWGYPAAEEMPSPMRPQNANPQRSNGLESSWSLCPWMVQKSGEKTSWGKGRLCTILQGFFYDIPGGCLGFIPSTVVVNLKSERLLAELSPKILEIEMMCLTWWVLSSCRSSPKMTQDLCRHSRAPRSTFYTCVFGMFWDFGLFDTVGGRNPAPHGMYKIL